jgi:hypothetical protein
LMCPCKKHGIYYYGIYKHGIIDQNEHKWWTKQ